MNFNDFKYNKNNVPEDCSKKYLFFEELKNKFYEEIKKSEAHKEYFSEYNPDSAERFMLEYADRRAYLAESYEYYIDEIRQNKELRYRERTEEIFGLIKQKKLFNLQLQWRAGKIKIKGIQMCYDFRFWEHHIDACPFLPPVTEEEVAVMKQFLKDNNFSDQTKSWFCQWQDYYEIMSVDEDDDYDYMPEWYEFYDGRMGTGALLSLPDIHGKKEEYYADIARKTRDKASAEEAKNPPPPYVPPPPMLQTGGEELFEYAQRFETDKHFIELFRLWKEALKPKKTHGDIYDNEVKEALQLLQEAEYPVYMPGGYEWREAILRCAQQYINNIIADELDTVYEEYHMFSEIGVSKGGDLDEIWGKYETDGIVNIYRTLILKGRVLCGEPRDFNF